MREYLVNLRMQHNESQQDVANALGVSRQYYAMIENGVRQKRMDIMIATGISNHFNVPLISVLAYEQESQKLVPAQTGGDGRDGA